MLDVFCLRFIFFFSKRRPQKEFGFGSVGWESVLGKGNGNGGYGEIGGHECFVKNMVALRENVNEQIDSMPQCMRELA